VSIFSNIDTAIGVQVPCNRLHPRFRPS